MPAPPPRRAQPGRTPHWSWLAGLLLAGWIVVLLVLTLTKVPRGAGSPAELAEQTAAAVNRADADAFSVLLPDSTGPEFAHAYIERLQQSGAAPVTATVTGPQTVELRGSGATDAVPHRMDIASEDGRWFLTLLPPM